MLAFSVRLEKSQDETLFREKRIKYGIYDVNNHDDNQKLTSYFGHSLSCNFNDDLKAH